MAESKNSFIQSKMNKDLDERLIPNNVYRDALNIAVSRSEGSDVGALESVLGNSVVSAGSGHVNLKIIGKLVDEANSLIYFFKTNYTGSADVLPADPTVYEMSIEVYNTSTGQTSVKVQGNFLNFSTLNPIYGVNLIENLLFWTDNRNAPRKINVDNPLTYYINADQISVCKWAPYLAPDFIDLRSIITPGTATHPSTMSDAADLPVVNIGLQEISSSNLAVTRYRNGDEIPHAPAQIDWNAYDASATGCWAYYDNSLGNGVSYGILYNKHAVEDSRNIAPIGYEVATENQWSTIAGITPPIPGTGAALKAEGYEYWENTLILMTPGSGYTQGTRATTGGTGLGLTVTITESGGSITDGVIANPGTGYTPGDIISISLPGTGGTFQWIGATEGTNTTQFNGRGAGERTNAGFIELKESTTFWTKDTDNFIKLTFDSVDATLETAPIIEPKLAGRSIRVIRGLNYNGWNGDPEYLKDKFVKFSYRFKFNDNEYSLVAPFSQDVFIPQQEGHFVNDDENEAFVTTVVEFMQNSINNAVLNITLPSLDIINDYKIKAIDIIVKQSDAQAYSVVETIPVNPAFITDLNNTNIYRYTYQSLLPVKTLTLQQTTRVFDKVPIKALSQESSGNRIMYGNFTQGFGTPFGLNYFINNNQKTLQTTIEYPNHSLKQNRNYQVGVILADKYGRQTDIILSNYDDKLDADGNPIPGSNIFTNYKPLSFSDDVAEWPGDNIQLNFNAPGIPENSTYNLASSDYPGAYAVGNYYTVLVAPAPIAGKYFWDLSNESKTATAGQTVFPFIALSFADTQISTNNYELYKNEGEGWIKLSKVLPTIDYTIASNAGVLEATLTSGATVGVVYKFRLLYTEDLLNKYQTGQETAGADPLIVDFENVYQDFFGVGKSLRGLYCDYTTIKTLTPLSTPVRAVIIFTTQEVATKYLFNDSTSIRPEPLLAADTTFATYNINPKGFYSYRLGVKQQQQDYYNVYLPGIINGYPIDGDLVERNEIAFTTLISDNINKIPRNLQDVGPLQNQFTSDEKAWARVTNINQVVQGVYKTYNKQFLPLSSPDSADLVGTIQDIYPSLDTTFSVPPASPTSGEINSFSIYDPETRPYVAKFSTQQGVGLTEDNFVIPSSVTNEPYPGGMSLAVYETAPVTVPFELFYETSTTGLISDLNDLIQGENTAINGMTTPTVVFDENDVVGTTITSDIYPTINGTVYTGATGVLVSVFDYAPNGTVNTINFADPSFQRFDAGTNTSNTSIFIRTSGANPNFGGTFYAGSSSEGILDVQFGGKFLYTIEWSDNNVLTQTSGVFELANSTPVIVSPPIIPSLTIGTQWIFGGLGTIDGSVGGGTSPSGRNGSARNTDTGAYGNHGIFNVGSGSANLCWDMVELRITDTNGVLTTYTPNATPPLLSISDFFIIGQSALTGVTGDVDRECRFNLEVNPSNPLAAGYQYCIDFRLTDTIGASVIYPPLCFGPPANSYTSVEYTTYTSGPASAPPSTQPTTILIGGGIIPNPFWTGQIQNWSGTVGVGQIVYMFMRFKVDAATQQPFIVEVKDVFEPSTGDMGFYPDGTAIQNGTATPSFPIQSAAAEGWGVIGISMGAFGAQSNAIANGVRPGQKSDVTPGTYGPYNYNTSSFVNLKYSITQDPFIPPNTGTWEAELMWSTFSNPSSLSQLNSLNARIGSVPPFYSNTTSLSLTTPGTGYGTSGNPYLATSVSGIGSGMTIDIGVSTVPPVTGEVTSFAIVSEGSGYVVGDVLSITQTPNGVGATFTIIAGGTGGSQIAPTYTPIPHGPS
jgi:hypothetical protein